MYISCLKQRTFVVFLTEVQLSLKKKKRFLFNMTVCLTCDHGCPSKWQQLWHWHDEKVRGKQIKMYTFLKRYDCKILKYHCCWGAALASAAVIKDNITWCIRDDKQTELTKTLYPVPPGKLLYNNSIQTTKINVWIFRQLW